MLCRLRLTLLLKNTINDDTKGSKSSKVSSCEQTISNALSSTTNVTTEKGRINSEDLNRLYDGINNLQSKGSDLDSSCKDIKLKDWSSRAS